MTYLTFHFVFILPPIILLLVLLKRPLGFVGGWRGVYSIPLVCLIALVYTTPWDNYLVYRGVWGYGADRVIATIGYVPIEEYLFFILQPILTGLFTYVVLQWKGFSNITPDPRKRHTGTSLWGGLTLLGWGLLASGIDEVLYMGLILGWACPILTAMFWYAGNAYISGWGVYVLSIAIPTIYLTAADIAAINMGIWHISDVYTIGFNLLNMPFEEGLFFFVTNVLVVQGVLLFLFGDRIAKSHRPGTGPYRLAQYISI